MRKKSKSTRGIITFPNDKIYKKECESPQWFWNKKFKNNIVAFFAAANNDRKLFIPGIYGNEGKDCELLELIIESLNSFDDLKKCKSGLWNLKKIMCNKCGNMFPQQQHLSFEQQFNYKLKCLEKEKLKKDIENLTKKIRKREQPIDYELVKKIYLGYHKLDFVKKAFKGYLLYAAIRCTGNEHNAIEKELTNYSKSSLEHFRARYNAEKHGKIRRSESEWETLYYIVKELHAKKLSYNEIMEELKIGKREYVAKFIKMESYTSNWRKIIL